jgi:hypothetical protein
VTSSSVIRVRVPSRWKTPCKRSLSDSNIGDRFPFIHGNGRRKSRRPRIVLRSGRSRPPESP